jgi:hypothetical protein
VQSVALTQDTPVKCASAFGGSGLATIDQAVPFQRSINVLGEEPAGT